MPERCDTDIDRELEYLELQECPDEIENLVCPIRQELFRDSRPNEHKSTVSEDLEGFRNGSGPSPRGELVIQPLPTGGLVNAGEDHFTSDEDPPQRSCGSSYCDPNGAFYEDMPIKSYMQAVVERLSQIESRLEEQQGWMERNLLNGRSRMTRKVQEGGLDYNLLKEWSKQSMRMSKRSLTHPSEAIPTMPGIEEKPPPQNRKSSTLSQDQDGTSSTGDTVSVPRNRRSHRKSKALTFKEEDDPRNSAVSSVSGSSKNGETIMSRNKRELAAKRREDRASAAPSEATRKLPDKGKLPDKEKPKIFSASSSIMVTNEGLDKQSGILYRIVVHPAFDYYFASMIMLNSLFIGVQTEYRARASGVNMKDDRFFEILEQIFAYMFAIELLMRMGALKMQFFNPKTLSWNVFDMLLVIMSIVEIVLNIVTERNNEDAADTSNAGKVIRMFRMARIVRIMRVLRFLAELRIMVTLIMNSARSLFWLMILLLGILYVFSIFFTQGVTDFLRSPESNGTGLTVNETLATDYGTLLKSAYTLFASITGGVSWRDVLNPLTNTGAGFTALFICYVFFCIFSVLNIVTGVFVDGAIQRSSQERDLRLEKEKEQKKMYVSMLTDLLEEIDSEGTGVISREDLEEAFKSEQVRYYFSVLDIDVTDSNYLFDMLDLDRSGEVDMEEFVSGCLRLKGNAKSIDIHTLMYEIKLMIKQMSFFMEYFFQESRKGMV